MGRGLGRAFGWQGARKGYRRRGQQARAKVGAAQSKQKALEGEAATALQTRFRGSHARKAER